MKLKMFAIFDTASEAYMTPWFMVNRATALRAFNQLAKDSQSQVNKSPSDYVLYEIGTWDDNTGAMDEVKLINLGHPTKDLSPAEMVLVNRNIQNEIPGINA